MALVGRSSELEAIEALLEAALEGLSGVLVIRGEAGVGKTALLDDAAELAADRGMQVSRLAGIESESQLGYAALHRLLSPYWGHVERLPDPQRDALKSTFGPPAGPPADRFMVALAVLTLLADVATEEPLLCLVDDGHWLDPETQVVLAFVARRLQAERVAMVLATRDMQPLSPSGALPQLVIGSLDDSAATDLLFSVSDGTVSPHVAGRLVASTGGNPLALVEMAKELTPEQLSGLSPLPEPLPAGRSLQAVFSRQVHRLPPESRLLLALAATEPGAPQATLWRAAAQLGVDPETGRFGAGGLGGLHSPGHLPSPPGVLGGLPPRSPLTAASDRSGSGRPGRGTGPGRLAFRSGPSRARRGGGRPVGGKWPSEPASAGIRGHGDLPGAGRQPFALRRLAHPATAGVGRRGSGRRSAGSGPGTARPGRIGAH